MSMTMRRLAEDTLAWIAAGIIMWFVVASYVYALSYAEVHDNEQKVHALRVYSDDSQCEGWEYLDSTGDVPKFDRSGF